MRGCGQAVCCAFQPETWAVNNATHYAYISNETGALILGDLEHQVEREVYRPSTRGTIDRCTVFMLRDHLVWGASENLCPSLWSVSLWEAEAVAREIPLPREADDFYIRFHDAASGVLEKEELQLCLTGFLVPKTTYLFDLESKVEFRQFMAEQAQFDASGMRVERYEARSEDGVMIPYEIVLPKEGQTGYVPVWIYAYGGYGNSVYPQHDADVGASWLASGGAYVLAHVRGGGEFGPEWHKVAKREGQIKTYQDMVAIARDLVARGISRPERIACHGASRGGCLMGAMLTLYPDDFG